MSYFAKLLPLALVIACNSSRSTPPEPENPRPLPPMADDGERDPREPVLAALMSRMLENDHLRARPLDDVVSGKAFEEYLESLDPGKMFLLASDVAELREFAELMDDQMRAGNLVLAHKGASMMRARLEAIAALVDKRLAAPFDYSRDETLQTDAEKRSFAASEDDLADRWRRALKLEVLNRVVRMEETAEALAKAEKQRKDKDDAGAAPAPVAKIDLPKTPEAREAKAREDLAKSYAGRFARMKKVEPLDGATLFLNSVASIYDPHTTYLPPADRENFEIAMSGSLEGIGAVLQEDDQYIKVVQIVPGGASWRQGELEAGDLILAVTQQDGEPVDTSNMRIDKVVKMIRGPKDSVVTLTVQKPDDRILLISITRDVVKIETAYARGAILGKGPGKAGVGYIYLPSFYGNTRANPGMTPERSCTQDVKTLLDTFTASKTEGVILDLRSNGGGLLDDAQAMSGLFIETGPIVQTQQPGSKKKVLADNDPTVSFAGHVVVLVDRFSASASEILAAALQDYRRAVIVGTSQTHGKGTVQVLLGLDQFKPKADAGPSLGVLKLTREQFFRINGGSTQRKGVMPDVLLPDPQGYLETGERFLDNAIPYSEIEPLQAVPWPAQRWSVDELASKSAGRQATNPVFTKIEQRNKLLESRRNDTVVPLARKTWLERRKREREALEAVSPEIDKLEGKLTVDGVNYSGEVAPAPRPGKSGEPPVDENKRWRDGLSRDPWLAEAVNVVRDMAAAN